MSSVVNGIEEVKRRKTHATYSWSLLGCLAIVFLNVTIIPPSAFPSTPEDEIAELKATMKALQRRMEILEAQQETKESDSQEIQRPEDDSFFPVLKGDFPGSIKPGNNRIF